MAFADGWIHILHMETSTGQQSATHDEFFLSPPAYHQLSLSKHQQKEIAIENMRDRNNCFNK